MNQPESIAIKGSLAILAPGQGAQAVGMGHAWHETSPAAKAVFQEADRVLGNDLAGTGKPVSSLCFEGPAEALNRTNISQPAIYATSIACWAGLVEQDEETFNASEIAALAGLSLGEWSVLHLAGAFSFAEGLHLVAYRGQVMQEAAEASAGGMVAIIGGDDAQADQICEAAAEGDTLVPANYNAPGQIVLSGHQTACDRAVEVAGGMGLRATALTVAGAFHSPLMQPAAEKMAARLAESSISAPQRPVWSNVTADVHDMEDRELLKQRLVKQITSPVRWSHGCADMIGRISDASTSTPPIAYHELAPGSVLRGLMRRIDRQTKVQSHDTPPST